MKETLMKQLARTNKQTKDSFLITIVRNSEKGAERDKEWSARSQQPHATTTATITKHPRAYHRSFAYRPTTRKHLKFIALSKKSSQGRKKNPNFSKQFLLSDQSSQCSSKPSSVFPEEEMVKNGGEMCLNPLKSCFQCGSHVLHDFRLSWRNNTASVLRRLHNQSERQRQSLREGTERGRVREETGRGKKKATQIRSNQLPIPLSLPLPFMSKIPSDLCIVWMVILADH